MRALLFGSAVFGVTVLAHLAWWRVRRPRGEYLALLMLCAGLLALALGVSWSLALLRAEAGLLLAMGLDYGSFMLVYVALALAYVSLYSAIQADSPSMSILLKIDEAGAAGLGLSDLEAAFPDSVLVTPRLNDLVAGELVSYIAPRYLIRRRGSLVARIHVFYRELLKMGRGG